MNWNEALQKINKNEPYDADIQLFCDLFKISYYDCNEEFAHRVKKYWIHSWRCTDTTVGLAAYYFDDNLVAISSQSCRKTDEMIQITSIEAYVKLHEFIFECIHNIHPIKPIDLNSHIDTWWFKQ